MGTNTRRPIEWRHLCAITRAVIEADRMGDFAEWVEAVKCTLVAQGWSYPPNQAYGDAIAAVVRALSKAWGPRPPPDPPRLDAGPIRPPGVPDPPTGSPWRLPRIPPRESVAWTSPIADRTAGQDLTASLGTYHPEALAAIRQACQRPEVLAAIERARQRAAAEKAQRARRPSRAALSHTAILAEAYRDLVAQRRATSPTLPEAAPHESADRDPPRDRGPATEGVHAGISPQGVNAADRDHG
jgi:hypothetical protein